MCEQQFKKSSNFSIVVRVGCLLWTDSLRMWAIVLIFKLYGYEKVVTPTPSTRTPNSKSLAIY